MPKSIRRMAITKNTATPKATARISVMLGMDGTCPAKTCKSGSEMVITNPIIKLIAIIKNRFFDFVMIVPVRSPIGVMESSTPTLKNSMPAMSRAAPKRNKSNIPDGMGAMVKHRKRTIKRIGKTALRVSLSFSLNLERIFSVFNYVHAFLFLFSIFSV